jgi:hypothetical protein
MLTHICFHTVGHCGGSCREQAVLQQSAAVTSREQQVQQQAARYHQVEQLLDALAHYMHQSPAAQVR